MKKINGCLGVLFMALLCWQVHLHIPYQLSQLEHTNLFVGDWDCFLSFVKRMGGMVQWLGTWSAQFFNEKVTGAIAFSFPVMWLTIVMTGLLRNLGKNMSMWIPLVTVVSVSQLLSLFDYNFYWVGALALALAMTWLWVSSFFRPLVRNLLFLLGIPMVIWMLGAVACLYVLSGVILFADRKKWKMTVLTPLVIYTFLVAFLLFIGEVSRLGMFFLLETYYESVSEMPLYHWSTWIAVLLVLVVARLAVRFPCKKRVVAWTVNLSAWLVPSVLLVQLGGSACHTSNQDLYRLNHYAYMEDWNAILDFMAGKPMNNYLFMNYANMALAHQGDLADRAFHYYPRGMNSLLATANSTGPVRLLASDIHYAVGCVAEAQQHAFEAQVTFPHSMGIQTMKRLVKTNLIFGHYEVAEKYLSLISKTTFHQEWAEKHRLFLYNDDAVEADAELGEKRRSLSEQNRFAMFYGWQPELQDILEANSSNTKALEYLGLSYLMNKDLKGFQAFLDKFYGIKEDKHLPLSFQQAVMALDMPEKVDAYQVTDQVKEQYRLFMRQYAQNRSNPNLKNLMHRSFGHTVWYYLIFV